MKLPLLSRVPLHTWIVPSSKVLILGDAAHAILPHRSQGAATAVEDGAALAVALNAIDNLSFLPLVLRAFEAELLERTSQMQEVSRINSIILHFPHGPEQKAQDEATRAEVEGSNFLVSANH